MPDKTKTIRFFTCILVFLSFNAFPLEPLAVSLLTPNGVTATEAISLTDALRSELMKTGKYKVMERSQMEQVLKEQGFQQSGACSDAACAIEIGKILSVNQIVLGNVGKVGETYTMNVRVVNVSTGEIIKDVTEYHKGSADGLLTKVIPVITAKLTGTYKAPSKTPIYVVAGGVVVAAVVVPVVYFATKKKPADATIDAGSALRVGW